MSEKYKELLEQYDVKVLSTFRSRGTFQCETEQGLALLKEYHGSLQKLALEYEWKEKLANAGFLTTDRYFLTKEESLVTYDRYRTPFVLKHYFKGRECDCRNLSDVAASCRNLAFLHKVSSSIEEIPFENLKTETTSHLFERKNRELRSIRKFAGKMTSNFFTWIVLIHFIRKLPMPLHTFLKQKLISLIRTVACATAHIITITY